jgi:hypothetical protein
MRINYALLITGKAQCAFWQALELAKLQLWLQRWPLDLLAPMH